MIICDSRFPRYFTFREDALYCEDRIIRHIEPAASYQLELQRLNNFTIEQCFIDNRRLHFYHAVGKNNPSDIRFFVRAVVYPGQNSTDICTKSYIETEVSRILTDILDALEILRISKPDTDCNHVFISFLQVLELDLDAMEKILIALYEKHVQRVRKSRVASAEIKFVCQCVQGLPRPIRVVLSSVSGFVTKFDVYQEMRDAMGIQKLTALTLPPGELHNQPVLSLYKTKESIQPKRYKAHLLGTTYIYDFPQILVMALKKQWLKYERISGAKSPSKMLHCAELILEGGKLVETYRPPGSNTIGMVAWKVEAFTPEYPEGRQFILVGNDITFNIGSFGPEEDELFFKASEYARVLGIPRVYISANSGARIGLAQEVLESFKIAWIDENAPSKGFEYLYLDESDYLLMKDSVNVTLVSHHGQSRYRIDAIIGKSHGLGVENLQGSGLIAGETSRAYRDIFTLTLVTCRSVGIGAYLVRLGQRAIQVESTPIILTGAGALNKVLGREVYSSNIQLGGTQIMHRNGVSHLVAANDLEGAIQMFNWMSYVSKKQNEPLPVLLSNDWIGRDIKVPIPTADSYDPRILLCGRTDDLGQWMDGFFDKDSFTETLSGWAKGVVVGRARLGGIPIGAICVETRSTEQTTLADPANQNSTEHVEIQAGQVWYPNSAFKTAQAIRDFNYGEQLPLIIFANWRGFSGGQGDMFKEILKFGADIVDSLREYRQPVFIYLIGELRGGAWVVLDPSINPEMMEMYCSENSRGGVLEPEGVVEIKFRKPQLLKTIERLDRVYKELKLEPHLDNNQPQKLKEREDRILSVYSQVSVEFADLHDRPGRMQAKKVVEKIIPWTHSRTHFYWRLLLRVSEQKVIREISKADETIAWKAARDLVAQWFTEDISAKSSKETQDQDRVQWLNSDTSLIFSKISQLQ